ncbi:hypothetical protein GGS20DRAFT_584494 [Poronia punctata]|nr:hypothetical protein GGS20DRAFT_584494 [Poronia punctata]
MPENPFKTQTGKSDAGTHSNPASEATKKAEQFAAHKAHPGPVIPESMPPQEGTKEEREAKAQTLNN